MSASGRPGGVDFDQARGANDQVVVRAGFDRRVNLGTGDAPRPLSGATCLNVRDMLVYACDAPIECLESQHCTGMMLIKTHIC
jgi:hypothetical protein